MLIAPFFLILLIHGGLWAVELACFLYFIGSLSDFFDGWLARRYDSVSSWGKFIDPLADKILTTSAFAAFVMLGIIQLWMVVIIVVRDFGTTSMRLWGDSKGKPLVTSLSAKWKTFLQMLFIAYILLLLLIKNSHIFTTRVLNCAPAKIEMILKSDATYYAMLFLTILTIWTLIDYIFKNKTIFHFSTKKDSGEIGNP